MRTLFASEKRSITNLFQTKWQGKVPSTLRLVAETNSAPERPHRKPWFNCDFILDFVDWRKTNVERDTAVCSVLPNAIGAELFLVAEKSTLVPTALELNGGSAFSIGDFSDYVSHVESAIQKASRMADCSMIKQLQTEVLKSLCMKSSAFVRLLVVGNDITFLYFPYETKPVMQGCQLCLAQSDDQEIYLYADENRIVCFDGWIRASVAPSRAVLASVPS